MATAITTHRLILRDYQLTDFEGIHAYAADPEVVRFMTWGPNTPEDTRAFIQLAISQQGVKPRANYHFVAALKTKGQIIGGCGIHIEQSENRAAYIGYGFNRHFWGQGFATESAQALLKFGFEQLNLHRTWATCDPQNFASARVLEKIGMTCEGRLREHKWNKGACWPQKILPMV